MQRKVTLTAWWVKLQSFSNETRLFHLFSRNFFLYRKFLFHLIFFFALKIKVIKNTAIWRNVVGISVRMICDHATILSPVDSSPLLLLVQEIDNGLKVELSMVVLSRILYKESNTRPTAVCARGGGWWQWWRSRLLAHQPQHNHITLLQRLLLLLLTVPRLFLLVFSFLSFLFHFFSSFLFIRAAFQFGLFHKNCTNTHTDYSNEWKQKYYVCAFLLLLLLLLNLL